MRSQVIILVLLTACCAACIHSKYSLAADTAKVSNLFREKRYVECLPLYKRLAAKTYQEGFYHYMTARCYAALDDYSNCARYLKKSIRYSPYYFEKFEDEQRHFEGFNKSAMIGEVRAYGQQQVMKNHWHVDSTLLKDLLMLSEQDQRYRKRIVAAASANDKVLYDSLRLLQRKIDTTVNVKFLALIEKKFPDNSNVSVQGVGIAMNLIQHLPHDAKIKLLPVVEKQVRKHYLSYASYANLYDRIRMEAGQCQKYGTQQQITDAKPCLYCVEDEQGLTERRAKIGFPPVDTSLSICIKKALK